MSLGRSLPKSGWLSAGSLVLMVVGAFGPWVTVGDLITIHGTDDGHDGWVVVGAAGVAVIALLLFMRSRRGWLLVFAALAGLAGAGTAAYDVADLRGMTSGGELLGSSVETGWGIYVALAGCIGLVLASVGLALQGRRGAPGVLEAPSGVQGG